MKKQVVVLYGGRTFDNYKQYITSLKKREVTADTFKSHASWRESLVKNLGRNYEVFTPKMPNPNNSVYNEWKIWFEKITPFLKNNVILIGHSLGGIFLAMYFSEKKYAKKIKAVFLVAAPYDDATNEPLGDFILPKSLKKFSDQAPLIYVLQSKDDDVVPFKEAYKYQKALPTAKLTMFGKKGHFALEKFPELVSLIKHL